MMLQPNQMWLDGAYMAGPFSCMYDKYFGDEVLRERAIKQVLIMHRFMKDEKSGLYYHGWDASYENKEPWADKTTGLSSEIWGRAVGWYAVAILDILEYIPQNHPDSGKLKEIEKDLLDALMNYRDEKTGLWYEVLDKPAGEGNWIESSCSCLFVYAYAKAINMGIADAEKYSVVLEKAYNSLISSLGYEDGFVVLDNICIGTCIEEGTYDYYIKRPVTKNDLHGSGAFVLMCEAVQRYFDFKK